MVRRLVVDHLKITYEGLFSVTDLYQAVDNFFREKGFDKREVRNAEYIKPEGKYIEIEMMPWKKVSDYARHVIRVDMKMFRIKEVIVAQDGHKVKLNKGRINVIIDGFLDTDYEGRWETRPAFVFLRTVFDKFIYKTNVGEAEGLLVENVNQVHGMVKAMLNLYRYQSLQAPTSGQAWHP